VVVNGVAYDTNYAYLDHGKIHLDTQYNSFSDWMKRLDKCENQHELERTYSYFWAERYSFPIIYLEFANEWVAMLAYKILDKENERLMEELRSYE
jgi:hypothetical protein